MKKEPQENWYTVPMEWQARGYARVQASSPEEAIRKCEALDCELIESGAEVFDWEVTGKPKQD